MVFYLKVNRTESWAIKCLQHWINTVRIMPGENKIYLLCDREDARMRIAEQIRFGQADYEYMVSNRTSPELTHIVSHISNKKWTNAAYAHLTTFLHARDNGISDFWNIDADDTYVCLSPRRVGEMLKSVENYAAEHKIDIFSLDMWRTRFYEKRWSFGVTYTSSRADWLTSMSRHCDDLAYKNWLHGPRTVDEFVTYLKSCSDLSIETYYFENLRFIHYSEDFFTCLRGSGFYHWKDGMLNFPVLQYCVGDNKAGQLSIAQDNIGLDIDISDNECLRTLTVNASDRFDDVDELLEQIPAGSKVIIYRAREVGNMMAEKILKSNVCELVCIADRNYKTLAIEGVNICSIDTALHTYQFDYVVISSTERKTCRKLQEILMDKGVKAEQIISLFPCGYEEEIL